MYSEGNEYWKNLHQGEVDEYLDAIVKNKTIIECDTVDCDLSAYSDISHDDTIVCHVRYRVVSADELENKKFTVGWDGKSKYCCKNNVIFPISVFSENTYLTEDDKLGEWHETFINVKIKWTYDGRFLIEGVEISGDILKSPVRRFYK